MKTNINRERTTLTVLQKTKQTKQTRLTIQYSNNVDNRNELYCKLKNANKTKKYIFNIMNVDN